MLSCTVFEMEIGNLTRVREILGSRVSSWTGLVEPSSCLCPSLRTPLLVSGYGILKFVQQNSFSAHLLYSLLCGRPLVVAGSFKAEKEICAIVNCLAMFVPGHSRFSLQDSSQTVLPRSFGKLIPIEKFSLWRSHQEIKNLFCSTRCAIVPFHVRALRLTDLTRFKILGLGRPDKKILDNLLPGSVRVREDNTFLDSFLCSFRNMTVRKTYDRVCGWSHPVCKSFRSNFTSVKERELGKGLTFDRFFLTELHISVGFREKDSHCPFIPGLYTIIIAFVLGVLLIWIKFEATAV